jgi:hypothetical protein
MTTLLLALVLATATTQPGSRAVAASSARFEVDALDRGGAGQPARVMITNRETSRRHFISINSTLGELVRAQIRADDERVILICENGFAVVDPRGRVPADELYARQPIASPDGRWIAYQRFYPDTHPGSTDAVALYDTTESSESNHAAYPAAAERGWHAGWAIYPPAGEWKDTSAVTPPADRYELSSMLAWFGEPSSALLVFTVRKGAVDRIVMADGSADPPRVCARLLPGDADRWRVKNITVARAASGHEVRIASRALVGDAPAVTFPLALESCGS